MPSRVDLRSITTIKSAQPAGRNLFEGTTPTFLPQDAPGNSRKPVSEALFKGKTPRFLPHNDASSSKKPKTRALFDGKTPNFLPRDDPSDLSAAGPSASEQLKLVTLTYQCGHKRYLSQTGKRPLRDHVDARSMMRSVHPTVTPLVGEHQPEATCPSCRVWFSGDKKEGFNDMEGSEDDGSDFGTDDEDEDDEMEEYEEDEDEVEVQQERRRLLRW
ncbi:MAG: hypothetical protein Q9209_006253 [Squamulea sp. 1 TL-2023]